MVNFSLSLAQATFDVVLLASVAVSSSGRRGPIACDSPRLFKLVDADAIDALQNVLELLFFPIVEVSPASIRLRLLLQLVVLDTLPAFLVGLEEVEAGAGDLVVDAVDFGGAGLLVVLQLDA